MDSGIGDDSNNQCQNSGSLFDEGIYIPQSPLFTNGQGTRCLIRDVDYTVNANAGMGACWFTSPQEVIDLIGSTSSYAIFDGQLEGSPHARPHICIDGNMATFYSPDDPAFYLHHTFIDFIWALWQDCHDYEGATPTPTIFSGSLSRSLEFTPYTATTYTSDDVLDLSDYGIIYEQGPLFSNVVVDASSDCPGTVNSEWFTPGRRRRLRDKKTKKSRTATTRTKKRIRFKPLRKSQKKLQELLSQPDEIEIEVEECENGRNACPIPDHFEDCSNMTDDQISALTIQDIISMEGLNQCQIVTREQEYEFAKEMGYLRPLCNGCMDPVCDHSIYYEKCSIDNNAKEQYENAMPIMDYKLPLDSNQYEHDFDQEPILYEPYYSNKYNPNYYVGDNILVYLMVFICIVLLFNIVTMAYMNFCKQKNKYASYDKVTIISTDSE